MTTLEIINPIPRKGHGRSPLLSRDTIRDEANYIELGLIVRDTAGFPVRDKQVVVTSNRDASQNRTMEATGNVVPIFVNEQRIKVHFYPFHYEFRQPGTHKITFTCDGITVGVDLLVTPDNRPETS